MSINISDLIAKTIPDVDDLLHLREAIGIGKKIEALDLKEWINDAVIPVRYSKSSDYVLTNADLGLIETIIDFDTSGGNRQLTLPAPDSDNENKKARVNMSIAGNDITFSGTGLSYNSDLKIEGDAGGFVILQSDGSSAWELVGLRDSGGTSYNGWEKLVGGTLLQWKHSVYSIAAASTGWQAATWTFTIPFKVRPSVMATAQVAPNASNFTANRDRVALSSTPTTTSCSLAAVVNAYQTSYYHGRAIGRWRT